MPWAHFREERVDQCIGTSSSSHLCYGLGPRADSPAQSALAGRARKPVHQRGEQLPEELPRDWLRAGRQPQQHRKEALHDAVEARRCRVVADVLQALRRRCVGACAAV